MTESKDVKEVKKLLLDNKADIALLNLIKRNDRDNMVDPTEYFETVYKLLRFKFFGEIHPLPESIMTLSEKDIYASEILLGYCYSEDVFSSVCVGDEVRTGRITGHVIAMPNLTKIVILDKYHVLNVKKLTSFFKNYALVNRYKTHHIYDIERGYKS
ncbi:MAG: hypothetical protein QW745_08030 [Thermoplasmata archaeon]|uniref:hypothetical protein n=1 Tax=Metallosphaera sp. TaxID=2020860 RepID=UPI00317BF296